MSLWSAGGLKQGTLPSADEHDGVCGDAGHVHGHGGRGSNRMGSAVVRGEAEAVSPHVRDGLSDESDHVFAGGVEWIEWIGLNEVERLDGIDWTGMD